jgi:hypothetical protein
MVSRLPLEWSRIKGCTRIVPVYLASIRKGLKSCLSMTNPSAHNSAEHFYYSLIFFEEAQEPTLTVSFLTIIKLGCKCTAMKKTPLYNITA